MSSRLRRLLAEKNISQITISEIISAAEVAHSSFYRNYTSKENVITTLICDILEEYRANMKNDGDNVYTYENIRMGFEFFSLFEWLVAPVRIRFYHPEHDEPVPRGHRREYASYIDQQI